MIHSGNIFQSCSRRFLLVQERKAAKNAALISRKLKHLGKRLIYLKPVPFFSDIGSEDCFLCTTPSKELKKHLQMQLKKWTLSRKKWKKKIAVNIWSTDSLFFILKSTWRPLIKSGVRKLCIQKYVSKYFEFHILQDIFHTFAKKQIAWIHKNLFPKIFWVFIDVASERRIARLTENMSCDLSWFLCSVWIQISTNHYKTDRVVSFLPWLAKIITIIFPQPLAMIKLGKSINKWWFSVFNRANLVWEILLLPRFVKLWFS